MWNGRCKETCKLMFQALALCWSESKNCGVRVVYIQKDGATLLIGAWQHEKQQNRLVEWKAFVDTVRIQSANFKSTFLSEKAWKS